MREFIEGLLKPMYGVMVTGLIVRSVALLIALAISYATWNILLRLAIEVVAALGMVGLAEIVMGHAAAIWAVLKRELRTIRNDPRYVVTNTRLKKERFEVEQAAKDRQRELALQDVYDQIKAKMIAMGGSAFITIVYGGMFALVVLGMIGLWAVAVTEIVAVLSVPFFNWYVNAEYEERGPDPQKRAEEIMLASVDGRLLSAKQRFEKGEETEEDKVLLRATAAQHGFHSQLIRALMRPVEGVVYMTTPELYVYFGATTASQQTKIRRRVAKAGENWECGVIWDEDKNAWLTPKHRLPDLFDDLITGAARARHRANTPLTITLAAPRQEAKLPDQRPNDVRTPAEHEPVTVAP